MAIQLMMISSQVPLFLSALAALCMADNIGSESIAPLVSGDVVQVALQTLFGILNLLSEQDPTGTNV
jgi:hypothetical protein